MPAKEQAAVAVVDSAQSIIAAVDASLTPERIEVVRRTVARGATDDELAMFFSLAARYELDPFAKEVWCICNLNEDGSRKTDSSGQPYAAQITASRDGFLAIANRHPEFDGMDSDVVCEKDEFQRTPDGVQHSYGAADRGKPRGAYALVYRKDRARPTYFFAKWGEYGEPNAFRNQQPVYRSPWFKYPSAMILKVAEAMALKRAFSLSGLTAEEELDAGRAIEDGADGALPVRQALPVPGVSAASRGIGRAHTEPAVLRPQRAAAPTAQEGDEPEQTWADDPENDEKLFGGTDAE